MTEFQIDNDELPVISRRGAPDKAWGMQDPRLSQRLYIDSRGILSVKGAVVSAEVDVNASAGETSSARPYLSATHAAVLVTALAVASEQSLSYDGLPLPDSTEGQLEQLL
jgi:hypothetical protein